MDKYSKGAAFSRPPPTSPRDHPKKKQRRDGPPEPGPSYGPGHGPGPHGGDTWSQRRPRPPSPSPSTNHFGSRDSRDDPRDSRPPLLGGYVVRNAPPGGPEIKIRGRSHAPAGSEAGGDESASTGSDQEPAPSLPTFRSIENAFFPAAAAINSHAQKIDSCLARFNYAPTHPVSRATASIRARVDQLSDVFHSLANHTEGMAAELDRLAAREHSLKRDLEDAHSANFNLSCARTDLADQVHALKAAAAETDVEVRRLRHDTQDLQAKHDRLEVDHRALQEGRKKMATEKLWLEETIHRQEAEIEKADLEARRLQTLDQDKDDSIESLQSNNLVLHSMVQQRGAEVDSLKVENARLQGIVRERDAQIAQLAAAPTPLSPARQFSFPAAQSLPPALPARQSSSGPYIKQEAPEQTALAVVSDLRAPEQAPYPTPTEPRHDFTTQLSNLATGAATVLTTLLSLPIPTPSAPNPILTSFLTNLGATTTTPPIPRSPTRRRPWRLLPPWSTTTLPTNTTPLRPTLQERFTQLCLTFPFPGSTASYAGEDGFTVLTDLLAALTEADYTSASSSSAAQTGWAFLRAMSDTILPVQLPVEDGGEIIPADRQASTTLVTLLLCELCRVLEETYGATSAELDGPAVRRVDWGLDAVLGRVIGEEVRKGGVGRLVESVAAAAVSGVETQGGNEDAVAREMATTTTATRGGSAGSLDKESAEGEAAEESQIGLLHCGSNSSEFLILDFAARTLRVVDCRLASMRPNGADPRKLDLMVSRPVPAPAPVEGAGVKEEGGVDG
ncbi:hypothetical protein C8A05DRAFT_39177, partial [Staphylotrichum tortipilum]